MKLIEAVEPRHRWAALGSVLLHVLAAFVLSIQPAPQPEPELLVEVVLEPPPPEQKRAKSRLAKKPAKPKTLPDTKPDTKPVRREPHTLTAHWQAETKPASELPKAMQLPEQPVNLPVAAAEPKPIVGTVAAVAPVAPPRVAAVAPSVAAASSASAEPVAAPAALPEGAQQPARVAAAAGEAGGDLSLPGSAAGRAVMSAGDAGQGLLTDRLSASRTAQATQGNAAWSQVARAAASPDDQRGAGLATAAAPTVASNAQEKAAAGGIASALASKASATPAAGNATALPQLLRVAGGGARGPASREGGKAVGQAAMAHTQATARATPGEGGFTVVTDAGQQRAPGSAALLNASASAKPRVVLMGSGGAPTGPAYALITAASSATGAVMPMRFERALPSPQAATRAVTAAGAGTPAVSAAPTRAQATVLPGDGVAVAMAPVEARMAQSHTPGNGGRLATQLAGAGKANPAREGMPGADLVAAVQAGKAAAPAASGFPGGAAMTGTASSAQAIAAGEGATQVALSSQQARLKGDDACLPGLETEAPNMFCHVPQTKTQPVAMVEKVAGVEGQPSYARGNPPLLFSPIVPGGRLLLRVHILKDGTVDKVLIKESSKSRMLDDDTVNQILGWRFNPAMKAGQAVDIWVDLPVTYRKPGIGGWN